MPPQQTNNQRLYVIGDIHGRVDLLDRIQHKILADATDYAATEKQLIFLGDYIDRGSDSHGVIRHLIEQLPKTFTPIFLRGNHEQVMLDFLAGDDAVLESWLHFGGTATLASYGVPLMPRSRLTAAMLRSLALEKIPTSHLTFLQATQLDYSCGDYYFVHAGIRPGVPLPMQTAIDKLWIRQEFLNSTLDHGQMIIHGHTITMTPDIQPNRIGIDTGAYATGKLTCLILHNATQEFLST